ncbi:hypothetical protein KCV87_13540 [Actinosynnema pretiosum subsp. pretiosum]|uniref:Peptidase MA-like domain-containing protein n=1 Tax=Actinosynnema pretiosum subsp. pretiosum TaxID=103721 RepID=A0AA45LCZ2_9PSEU|nr:hypothetical protein APASM_1340 [Actinosynnema pretiosum subsp. pretiosum]QUF06973.1 hypothetical protein KCV87_13540 [Actinosynnema pretiosum subsp. pretiosum]
MSRARTALAVLAALALSAGLVAVLRHEDVPDGDAPAGEAVRALLDRRARAVLERDEAAFTADLDPEADPAFLAAQRGLFAALAEVPLAEWSYRVAEAAGDESGGDERALTVLLSHRLSGVDERAGEKPLGYLFSRRGDRWRLTSDTAPGRTTWRGPWDFGPVRAGAARGGLVLAHPGGEAQAARALVELDDAVDAVTEVLGPRWSGRVAVLVPSGDAELRALVGDGFASGGLAAVAVSDPVVPGQAPTGQRVVLNPVVVAPLPDVQFRVLLRHEITHVATRASVVDGAPMWLLEGFADHVGHRGSGLPADQVAPALAARVRAGAPPSALPPDADFRGAGIDLAYQEAWSFAEHLARAHGEPALLALHDRLTALGPAAGSDVDAALRATTGAGLTEQLTAWRGFLTTTFTP